MTKQTVFEKIEKLCFVFICLLMADCSIFGAGRLVEFGPIGFRMMLFAIVMLLAIPSLLRSWKQLLKNRFVQILLVFAAWLVFEAIVGFAQGHNKGMILTDLKGFAYFVFLPVVLCVVNTHKRMHILGKVIMYSAAFLAVAVCFAFFMYVFVPKHFEILQFLVPEDNTTIGVMAFTGITRGIPRIFSYSCLYLLCGCAFSIYYQTENTGKFRWRYSVILALCLFALLLTYTRSVYLAVFISAATVFIVFLFLAKKGNRGKFFKQLIAGVVLFGIITVGLGTIVKEDYLRYAISRVLLTLETPVTPPTEAKVSVQVADTKETMKVTFQHGTEHEAVNFAVWSDLNGQDDLQWYSAQKNADGLWEYTVDLRTHNTEGVYYIHVYSVEGDVQTKQLETTALVSDSPVSVNVSAADQTMKIAFRPDADHEAVNFAVWSELDGQDDLQWYPAQKTANGLWEYTVDLRTHNTEGVYYIHIYSVAGDVLTKHQETSAFFSASPVSANVSEADQTMKITFRPEAAHEAVRFAVWSDLNGQDDLQWYPAQKRADGLWEYTVDLRTHNTQGMYIIHVYSVEGDVYTMQQDTSAFFSGSPLMAMVSDADGTMKITFQPSATYEMVRFAVWSDLNGQDDLMWYPAQKRADGLWEYTIDLRTHNTTGMYYIHVYSTVGDVHTMQMETSAEVKVIPDSPATPMKPQYNDSTVSSDQLRALTVAELLENIKKSPIIGSGLGLTLECRDNKHNEYFYLDIMAKTGVIGLVLFLLPLLSMIFKLFTDKRMSLSNKRLVWSWIAVLLGFCGYSYFNPYMGAAMGILLYCCTIGAYEVSRNCEHL